MTAGTRVPDHEEATKPPVGKRSQLSRISACWEALTSPKLVPGMSSNLRRPEYHGRSALGTHHLCSILCVYSVGQRFLDPADPLCQRGAINQPDRFTLVLYFFDQKLLILNSCGGLNAYMVTMCRGPWYIPTDGPKGRSNSSHALPPRERMRHDLKGQRMIILCG